jgi:hypothetical protein
MREFVLLATLLALPGCGSEEAPRPNPIDARVQPARDAAAAAESAAVQRQRDVQGILSDTTPHRSPQ